MTRRQNTQHTQGEAQRCKARMQCLHLLQHRAPHTALSEPAAHFCSSRSFREHAGKPSFSLSGLGMCDANCKRSFPLELNAIAHSPSFLHPLRHRLGRLTANEGNPRKLPHTLSPAPLHFCIPTRISMAQMITQHMGQERSWAPGKEPHYRGIPQTHRTHHNPLSYLYKARIKHALCCCCSLRE